MFRHDTLCLLVLSLMRSAPRAPFIYTVCRRPGAANNHWWSVRAYSNCNHAFHQGGTESGGNGYHSRLVSTYVGPL